VPGMDIRPFEAKIPSAILFILGLITIFQLLEKNDLLSKIDNAEFKLLSKMDNVESNLKRLLHEMPSDAYVENYEIYELAEKLINVAKLKIRVVFFPSILANLNLPSPKYTEALEKRLKRSKDEQSQFTYQVILGYDQNNLNQLKEVYSNRRQEYAKNGFDRMVETKWLNCRVGITLFLIDDSALLLVFPNLKNQGLVAVLKFEDNSNFDVIQRISGWYDDLWNYETTLEPV
jgi:ribosomal protein S8